MVSRVWLYFAVQKSFGAILRQTSLNERLCQINTAFHCSLVHWRSHTWDTKEASTFTCFMIGFFFICSHQFHQVKTLHTGFLQNDEVWSSVRILGPHKPISVARLHGHYRNTWQDTKCKAIGRTLRCCPKLWNIWFQISLMSRGQMAHKLYWSSSWAVEAHNCKGYTD